MAASIEYDQDYDRLREVKQFDDSKLGVKGLIDAGVTAIPRFFIHSPEALSDIGTRLAPLPESSPIPTIDLSGVHSKRRSAIVGQVRRACREMGFFQIINHGIPREVMERTMEAVKAFHEQPTEIKARFYTRAVQNPVGFFCNIDLFHSKAATWRDTLQLRMSDMRLIVDDIPEICRDQMVEWDQRIERLAEVLMGVMCEGLGLPADKLKELTCLQRRVIAGQYYPPCPQPDLTVGIAAHTDPGILTVLMQDQVGGLQVECDGEWVDVKPVPGALVINVADVLQIMSNDEYKSVNHRVLANPHDEPRVSLGVFFGPGNKETLYGPFPELTSYEKPPLFRQFTYTDYLDRFYRKELDNKRLLNYYRV